MYMISHDWLSVLQMLHMKFYSWSSFQGGGVNGQGHKVLYKELVLNAYVYHIS